MTDHERVVSALYDVLNPMSPDRDDISSGFLAELAAKEITAYRSDEMALRDGRNLAYEERNRLVSVLSKFWPSHLCLHPDSDKAWDPEWLTIVCIHSPVGQLTWHIHDDHRLLFAHLQVSDGHWDGHTSADKYARLASFGTQY